MIFLLVVACFYMCFFFVLFLFTTITRRRRPNAIAQITLSQAKARPSHRAFWTILEKKCADDHKIFAELFLVAFTWYAQWVN